MKMKIKIRDGNRVWVDNMLYEGGKVYEVDEDVAKRIGPELCLILEEKEDKALDEPPKDKAVKKPKAKK